MPAPQRNTVAAPDADENSIDEISPPRRAIAGFHSLPEASRRHATQFPEAPRWPVEEQTHVIFSFGFEGGEQLAWSIEVRHKVGGGFSPLADLFKNDPLVVVAADERDVVGVRSNVRGEDVQIYPLRASPEQARNLLLEYVAEANALARTPQFYNSITTNCTTTVAKLMRVAGDKVPFDWRLIVNGYLPDYAYDRGAVDTSMPLDRLREIAKIDVRARADGLSPDFSKAIRLGVPFPVVVARP